MLQEELLSRPDQEMDVGVTFVQCALVQALLKWDRTPWPSLESSCVTDAPTLAVEFDESLLILY